MLKSEVTNRINQSKIVAVIRGENAEEALAIANASSAGGIDIIELTYTTPSVDDVFKEMASSDAIVGAGTVLDEQTARNAIIHGAKFIVSPHFDSKIAKLCNRYSVLYMPGCMTIKEIVQALEYGCSIIKLFPANAFEPNFIKSIKGPLPNVEVMPTGGINRDNINDWIDAGAFSVGIGSDLTKAYRKNNAAGVTDLAKEYVKAVKER
ncbi:bifunctional 2-keto-4-hydroxyglutarate aldolase/2-keto-3-deoxy-6-phosphogluconate aldolase [Virgibacillus sp. C22-A2]|uniref:Bifunctional 2-keto-4-hydroxyglutarate aldolase/2-keto-3-deoxy-6-phosphogluconate aldolase n=1 Tax=Virgibacillus tibetensis TaxID=3042313 RepID=A0ABU6KH85_9BACI|nr:bifunctional 2-keto-4-hydroxyglutarate aldolase/2-keto-3-deoxy-6-phosphogluconate aldolase [Virgibacillus sp. C22-A2]